MTAAVVEPGPREVLLRVRLGLPVVQLLAVAVTVAAVDSWSGQEVASDGRSGSAFWAVVGAWTLLLGLLAWAGGGLLRLTWRSSLRWPNVLAVIGEAATLVVVAPLVLVVPFAFVAESMFAGM